MNARDNVERRESLRLLPAWQFEENREAEERAANAENYDYHLNKACAAIRNTPFALVTNEYISLVLSAIESKAIEANLIEVADAVGCVAAEIEQ